MAESLEGPQEVLLMLFPEVHFSCEPMRQEIQVYFFEKLVKWLHREDSKSSYSSDEGFQYAPKS